MRDLFEGLSGIIRQIDQLMHTLADGVETRAEGSGEQLTAMLRSARERLDKVEQDFQRTFKRAARTTDRYVQDHPWPAIAIAAAAGFAIGALLAARRDNDD